MVVTGESIWEGSMNTKQERMTISEIVDLDKQEVLKVDPEYQRAQEWNIKQQRLLIDSLMRGYPIPIFYLHKKVIESSWATNTNFFIVDGQQRINAIVMYVRNQFTMFDPARDKKTGLAHFQRGSEISWAGKSFDALPESLRTQFLQTELSVVFIESESGNEIRDLFIRLQAGLPLSAQEKRDAWPGDFTKFVIETAGKKTASQKWMGHDFFRRVLKGSSARGNMRKLCASMFMQSYSRNKNAYAPDSFTSTNAVEIDNFYQYHVDFDSLLKESHAPRFREILDEATDLLADGHTPKIEANMAYNVILFLDLMMGNFSPDWRKKFVEAFHKFQERLLLARKSKDPGNEYWYRYGALTGVSAASKGQAEARYRFFEDKMLKVMSPLTRLDPKRAFSSAERELVYYRDEKKCYKCGGKVEWAEAEVDHAKPHALGGGTTLENARLVHSACHARGVNALRQSGAGDETTISTDKPWEEDTETHGKRLVLTEAGKRVTFGNLSEAGLIFDGCRLIYTHKNTSVEAEYHPPDSFVYGVNNESRTYNSFSKLVAEKLGSRNIWKKTEVVFPDGDTALLGDLRDTYLERSYSSDFDDED